MLIFDKFDSMAEANEAAKPSFETPTNPREKSMSDKLDLMSQLFGVVNDQWEGQCLDEYVTDKTPRFKTMKIIGEFLETDRSINDWCQSEIDDYCISLQKLDEDDELDNDQLCIDEGEIWHDFNKMKLKETA